MVCSKEKRDNGAVSWLQALLINVSETVIAFALPDLWTEHGISD